MFLDIIAALGATILFFLMGYRPPFWCTKTAHQWKTKIVEFLDGHRPTKESQKLEVKHIPGPVALPVLGTGWLFTIGKYKISKMHKYYEDMRNKYGPIFKEEALFNVPVISVFNKEDIEKVFKSTGKFPIRPPTEAIALYRRSVPERYASAGLTNEQGETWHYLRTSLTTVITSPKTINNFLPEMENIADDWCYLLENSRKVDGCVFNLEEFAGKLGLEATCALVLGRRMGFLLQPCKTAEKLSRTVHENFLACRDTYFGLPFWKWFSTPVYKRLCRSEQTIYELASELIQSADESTRESEVFQSVLHADIDEREKKSAIVDFLAAGIHTLKNSLLFFLYQIAMNPEYQRKILNDPTKSFLKASLMETFRLCPTVNSLARITESDLELSGGYRIPAGSVLLCHTSLACQNDRYFEDAKTFRPERWLDEEKHQTAANATYLVTPFGYGRRICPGKRFIEQVLPVVLLKTLQRFEIKVSEPLELEFEFLLAPKGPVNMTFIQRED